MKAKKSGRLIYLDHAATTPVATEALRAMEPFFILEYGNPSALHSLGVRAGRAITNSRKTIATILHTTPDTIIFTSGGTESNNLAIFGTTAGLPAVAPRGTKDGHIITTQIEHHSVLEPIHELKRGGWKVTYVPVSSQGLVNPADVTKAIQSNTILVSIMYANNEVGSVEPIQKIGRQLLRYRKEKWSVYPYFHTDACQAAGYLEMDVEKLHVDLMTVNASKIYGPKGVGMLYVRRGAKISPLILGGSQEQSLRSGTENVPGVVGLTKAMELAMKQKNNEAKKQRNLTEYFWKKITKQFPTAILNGPIFAKNRLPNNLNVQLPLIEAETLILYLDSYGIMCSTGSACTAQSSDDSHVLTALGLGSEAARHSVRFTLGRSTTKADIDYTIRSLAAIYKEFDKTP